MSNTSNISPLPFDGAAAWSTLSPGQQARIGSVALELAVALAIGDHAGEGPAERAAWEAERLATDALGDSSVVWGPVPDAAWVYRLSGVDRYRLPTILGQVCHSCGCSHHDPCDKGCGWHTDTQCTACAEAPAPVPELAPSDVKAVCRGACKALATSPVAELPGISAEGWGVMAERIATMHLDEGQA